MQIPDLTQRVIGYRQWSVKDDYELWPVSTQTAGAWKPGPQQSRCWTKNGGIYMPCVPVVSATCECGWYALHKLEDAEGYGGWGGGVTTVQGIVTGWGRMAVHGEGWRSEWVEIMAIICPDSRMEKKGKRLEFPEIYRRVARKYGVPLIRYSNATSFAREFGAEMPESLKPKPTDYRFGLIMDDKDFDDYPTMWGLRRATSEEVRRIKAESTRGFSDETMAVVDISDELDVTAPEAMAGLYDIYVPNPGDLLVCVHEPPKPTYERFPDEPIVPWVFDPLRPDMFHLHLSTTGSIAYFPKDLEA